MPEKRFSFTRLLKSFGYAVKGIVSSFAKGQVNIRIHVLITGIVIIAGVLFSLSLSEWIIVILCIGLVVSAEIMNTAIEKLVDIVSPEWSDKAGNVKDMAAGAVLVLVMAAVTAGCLIFAPKIWNLF